MMVSPERLRNIARARVGYAMRSGRLPRATDFKCVDCGEPAECWEHRDYTKPLDVDPVCKFCDQQRGAGLPLPGSPDIDVDWITSQVRVIRWRWGWASFDSRVLHHWNVEGDVEISRCGIVMAAMFGIKGSRRKCKRCEAKRLEKIQ